MDLLTTLLTCSLYLADDDLVRAIAESNSQSNPYFVLDATVDLTQVDPPPPPKNATEAVARTTDIVARGGRPVLGLLLVPPAWTAAFGGELAGAFDPCTNIAIGTAMLSQFDAECGALARKAPAARLPTAASAAAAHPPSAVRRRCVLSKYESAIGLADFAAAMMLELRVQRRVLSSVADAPIFLPLRRRAWGPDQLLVPLGTAQSNFASIP